jgi:hypothetical protein
MSGTLSEEIAAAAARLVVEDGMDYGPAKRRAAKSLGRGARDAELPDNDQLEDEVRVYLTLFCADTQPRELAALRALAITWMERLAAFRPHLTGAVWRGTATRLSDIHLELFCDDSKAAELALIDRHIDYDVSATAGPRGNPVDVLSVASLSEDLGESVTLHLAVLDYDDLRGALKGDAQGRSQRGNLAAVRALEAGT